MRIVVKIGSSSLVDHAGGVRQETIDSLASDIAVLRDDEHAVVLVSSGAIATGLGVLGRRERPKELPALQAASAVGQGALYGRWAAALERSGARSAQVLLTMHDVTHRSSYLNARNTLNELLDWGVVPIVNENDTTATDEITFGDNDTLAAQIAVFLKADILVLLTDTDGLYTEHPDSPGATLIERVDDHSLLRRIDTAAPGSHWGSGGMRSKVIAAEMASIGGASTIIARGATDGVLTRIVSGDHVGTHVAPDARRGSSFKLWLRYAKPERGVVRVDSGARRALEQSGASLLPIGVVSVDGEFGAGDAVVVMCDTEEPFAKGICEYSSRDLTRVIASPDSARGALEAIHRDQLVLLP